MRPISLALVAIALSAAPTLAQEPRAADRPAPGMQASQAELLALEKRGWEAWKNKDTTAYRAVLTDDAVSNGRSGPTSIDQMVAGLKDCEVRSYALDEGSARVKSIAPGVALLTFKATQDATCGGTAAPPTVWASSLYVRRGGQWRNVFYQETPGTP
jgi:hypothetical protein